MGRTPQPPPKQNLGTLKGKPECPKAAPGDSWGLRNHRKTPKNVTLGGGHRPTTNWGPEKAAGTHRKLQQQHVGVGRDPKMAPGTPMAAWKPPEQHLGNHGMPKTH